MIYKATASHQLLVYSLGHVRVRILRCAVLLGLMGCAAHLCDGSSESKRSEMFVRETSEEEENTPKRGEDWHLDSLALTLKWVPPGTFYQGSTQDERDWAADPAGGMGLAEWSADESDPEKIQVNEGFWVGQTVITRGMFRQFVESVNYVTDAEQAETNRVFNIRTMLWENAMDVSWRNPGYEQNDNHPVVFVSWNDAMAFCEWLNLKEQEMNRVPVGYEYRLPGESEWEYAACGGSTEHTLFWWGNDFSDGRGRVNGAGADRLPDQSRWNNRYEWEDGFVYTSPVDYYGDRARNGFGLADMAGNIWEWCFDNYNPNGTQSEIWLDDTQVRVLRGGSYMRTPASLRVANRGRGGIDAPRPHRGFRVVLAPLVESTL